MAGNLSVTGTITSDGLTVGDGHTIGDDGFDNLVIASSAAESIILNSNTFATVVKSDAEFRVETDFGTDRFKVDTSTGDISFYEDTGTTAKFFWDASAEALALGTTTSVSNNRLVIDQASGDGQNSGFYMQRNGGAGTSLKIDIDSSDVVNIRRSTTTALAIDSSGRVTTPYQPAFSAGHNSNAFNTSSGSAQVIYNHKMFDIGNNYNTSNGRFTAPVSGTYVFNHTATSRQASSIVFEVKVYQNGTERKRMFSKGPSASHGTSTTVMLYCSAGDYIESRGYWGTGVNLSGNLDLNASVGQGTASSFSGYLIG
jgi:hypothetical protein